MICVNVGLTKGLTKNRPGPLKSEDKTRGSRRRTAWEFPIKHHSIVMSPFPPCSSQDAQSPKTGFPKPTVQRLPNQPKPNRINRNDDDDIDDDYWSMQEEECNTDKDSKIARDPER